MPKYYIPDYVHFATESDKAVFLDLRKDQYSLLIGDQARTFSALVSSAPDPGHRVLLANPSTCTSDSTDIQDDVLTDLLQNGLLCLHTSASTELISPVPQVPQDNLLDPLQPRNTEISPHDLWVFLVSCAIAKWRLSSTNIENTVRTIRRRKLLNEGAISLDMDKARKLVSIYRQLRPLIPHDYLCLFDSLSLLEFLARHNCYPNWVFAVQLEPWGAHCWVQAGTTAFNEDFEWASTFLPVMSV